MVSFNALFSVFLQYRLDAVCFVLLGLLAGLWCRSARNRRKAGMPLPRNAWLVISACALVGALVAEGAGALQRNSLVHSFSGLGPTLAHELGQLGHARLPTDRSASPNPSREAIASAA